MNNIIHVPFTPRYSITIIPNSETSNIGEFARYDYSDLNVIINNHDIEKYHEQYIFGTETALTDYVNEVPAYKAPASEDHPLVVGMKNILIALQNCLKVMQIYGVGSREHREVFNYYWNNFPEFRSDTNAQRIKEQLGF